ncbi:MAG: hypothetical protein NC390_03635 [Fusobacterium sp.]|nr:hypothetical protein [Fusobacterium sp.]
MGLAASQARFLGITARKNSCELRSMQIAQEKLSITNKLTQISEDYQKSLDATRLVWDSDFITDGSIYDVSYELLMQPSELNGYSPQLLTNNRNQVVLDSQYANALKSIDNAGYSYAADGSLQPASFEQLQLGGASRTKDNFKQFLEALNKNGILSKNNLDMMTSALDGSNGKRYYNAYNGLGGYVTDKFAVESMNLATLKRYMSKLSDPSSDYMNELRKNYGTSYKDDGTKKVSNNKIEIDTAYDKAIKLGDLLNFNGILKDKTDSTTGEKYKDIQGFEYKDKDGNTVYGSFEDAITQDKDTKLKLSDSDFDFNDLMNKEITLSSDNADQMAEGMAKFLDSLYSIMGNFFAINKDSVDQDYLTYAMDQICKLNGMRWDSVNQQVKRTDGKVDFSSGAAISAKNPAKHTSIIKDGSNYQVSLSNMAKGLLTYFEKAVEGFDSGYTIDSVDEKKTENSFYITQDPSYYYFIKNPETLDIDDDAKLLLDYYSQMFNQICANGWTESNLVSEPEHLKNMLKNGTLFTSVLSDDGNFYQAPYTRNNFIAEVADQDAITRAEAEYKTQQLKLSAKEEELNIDMQMVDAELSALTTEYDTVKQMISKGVEKGFSTLGG